MGGSIKPAITSLQQRTIWILSIRPAEVSQHGIITAVGVQPVYRSGIYPKIACSENGYPVKNSVLSQYNFRERFSTVRIRETVEDREIPAVALQFKYRVVCCTI